MKLKEIRFDDRGLIPAIVQDFASRRVLTLAYMNAESLERTVATGETWFWSRSRASLWHKGATSGNTQQVRSIEMDCDGDALIINVKPDGPACHTGAQSCFYRTLHGKSDTSSDLGNVLNELHSVIYDRRQELPEDSYTTYLFKEGLDKILKKVGEEAAETIIAAKNDDPDSLVRETSDLLYHLLVLLVERGVTLADISDELQKRRKDDK